MKILIAGICGFVGSTIARALKEKDPSVEIFGIDNFSRPGSETNEPILKKLGIEVHRGDVRVSKDLSILPKADWVIDAAANTSVLAGVDGKTTSLELVEHNLYGTVNILEYCKSNKAGFVLLSTSRVYSIPGLANLKVEEKNGTFHPVSEQNFPGGISFKGVSEEYSTMPPVSLYGTTKVASEQLALEYGKIFDFPVWINRCGVLAGAGQFGHPEQGIFAFWIHSFREENPLKYIGFGGNGYQVRDCLHPKDLLSVVEKQFGESLDSDKPRILNFSGGANNSMSLYHLSQWSGKRFEQNEIVSTMEERQFDIPWMVLDTSKAHKVWGWSPETAIEDILEEIASFAEKNPHWLSISRGK